LSLRRRHQPLASFSLSDIFHGYAIIDTDFFDLICLFIFSIIEDISSLRFR